jgi:hypothetical protein
MRRLLAIRKRVALRDCAHYCGFRYGSAAFNPYERYAIDLRSGHSIDEASARFETFLRGYRPRTMSEALSIKLDRSYPVWIYPWLRVPIAGKSAGWVPTASAVVDVMTSFSDEGIPSRLLSMERHWHQQAQRNMTTKGYSPAEYGYVTVSELRDCARTTYVVTDGNHRVSALAAMGVEEIDVLRPIRHLFKLAEVYSWPAVQAGVVTPGDARVIFDAFVRGVPEPTVASPLGIVVNTG